MKEFLSEHVAGLLTGMEATDVLTIAASAVMLFFVFIFSLIVLLKVRKQEKTITVPAVAGTVLHLAMMVLYLIPCFSLFGALSVDLTVFNTVLQIGDYNTSIIILSALTAHIIFVSLGFSCWLYCALTGGKRFKLMLPLLNSLITAALIIGLYIGMGMLMDEGLYWMTIPGKLNIAVSAAEFVTSIVAMAYMGRKKRAAKKAAAAAALAEGNQTEENKAESGE